LLPPGSIIAVLEEENRDVKLFIHRRDELAKQSCLFRLCKECNDEAISLLKGRLPRSFANPMFVIPHCKMAKALAVTGKL